MFYLLLKCGIYCGIRYDNPVYDTSAPDFPATVSSPGIRMDP
jgi:hypothetical protein